MFGFGRAKLTQAQEDRLATLSRRVDDAEDQLKKLRREWSDVEEKMGRLAGRMAKRAQRDLDEQLRLLEGGGGGEEPDEPEDDEVAKRRGRKAWPGTGA